MSRWMSPRSCARRQSAGDLGADDQEFAEGQEPVASSRCWSVGPATYSMTRNGSGVSSTA